MPNLPIPSQTDVTIQNQTTGAVDYLEYSGNSLVSSALFDYGLGPNWHVVASDFGANGLPGLVAQNTTTGFVDFLTLDGSAHLIASAASSVPVPHIAGYSDDIGGGSFVSQLPNGQLDFLQFNSTTGALAASDLLPNTVGLPNAVGVAAWNATPPEFHLTGNTDTVITQLADGSVDVIGFTGSFGTTLTYSASYLIPGSAGTPLIGEVNPNDGVNFNVVQAVSGIEGLQAVSQTSDGHLDALYYDTGTNDATNTGILYASNLLNGSYAGWNGVDGGLVNHTDLFPIA
jgi:hypothetical protein